jgi:hypothetical protein
MNLTRGEALFALAPEKPAFERSAFLYLKCAGETRHLDRVKTDASNSGASSG